MADQFVPKKKIKGINHIGLKTMIEREVLRFLTVYSQTIIAPMITTLMFYTVFALAFGGLERELNGVPFLVFLAPGLIMMNMVQNSFANASSSLVISKIQGNIVDVLMPPLSPLELFSGYAIGSVIRGLSVGLATGFALAVFTNLTIYSFTSIITFAFLGTYMLGTIGIAAGIWADRFDNMASITNFVITPMTFLSGTFYSIKDLPEVWQKIASYNPFFFMIDGFRYGFTGQSDANVMLGFSVLAICNISLTALAYWMFKTGYKIKS
ncbi:MAG: multidrug ABC transporter permease [Alphaproteobacteria bacterium]|nr:multidrug ABC transporter permease [Alphaproteobacteria bacterium]